jgi:FKBP-type peptidyl-prolyl cis-trans isomerase (trigger factor)
MKRWEPRSAAQGAAPRGRLSQDRERRRTAPELEPQSRRRLERSLVLGEIVDAESLEVDEAEVDAALERILEPLTESSEAVRRALDTPAGRRRLRLDLLTDKAVARLVQIARGEAPPLTAPDLRSAGEPAVQGEPSS